MKENYFIGQGFFPVWGFYRQNPQPYVPPNLLRD